MYGENTHFPQPKAEESVDAKAMDARMGGIRPSRRDFNNRFASGILVETRP